MKRDPRAALPALLAVWGWALAVYLAPQSLSLPVVLLGWLWLAALCAAAWLLPSARTGGERALLWAGGAWTAWAALTLTLLRLRPWGAALWWLAGLNLALALLTGLPRRAFVQELALALWGGFAAPAWLYLLGRGDWHPWLLLLGLPLTLSLLAGQLAWGFSTFAADARQDRLTLVRRLGWPAAGSLHQVLLAAAFALLGFEVAFLGLPVRLFWPLFLALPLAGYQTWHLRNILAGLKPVWPLVQMAALALPLLLGYLLTVSLLLH